jgi:maltodextrin utilization protein YvdJ
MRVAFVINKLCPLSVRDVYCRTRGVTGLIRPQWLPQTKQFIIIIVVVVVVVVVMTIIITYQFTA